MKKSTLSLSLLAGFLLLSTSCASIFGHSSYDVSINSVPSEAQLTIVNSKGTEVFAGMTPATVRLKSSEGFFKRATYTLTFTKPGYDKHQTQLSADIQPWYFGNLLVGGVIGMLVIDPLTGAMWKLDAEQISVQLAPSPKEVAAAPLDKEALDFLAAHRGKKDLQIYALQDVPVSLRSQLVPYTGK